MIVSVSLIYLTEKSYLSPIRPILLGLICRETQHRHSRSKKMDRVVELYDDVLSEILSRLPAKSVCMSKCCSKSFLNITKAMDFAQKQSQNSLLRDESCFFIQNFIHRSQATNTELHTLLPSSSSATGIPSKFIDFVDEKLVTIIASSNGLVLCKIQALWPEELFTDAPMQLFICNPITGLRSLIPSPIPRGFEKDRRVIFSFECNNKDEDYTLYALERDNNNQTWNLVCKMYIPKEGLWKEIGTRFLVENKYMSIDQLPVFYKGSLHFILSEYPGEQEELFYLASYNVESGALRFFQAPRIDGFGEFHPWWCKYDVGCIFKWGKIGSKEESICLVKLYDCRHFMVWVLSDNESSSGVWSWSNILSSVSLEELGFNDKNSIVRRFTVMNGHSLVFVTDKNEVYDYDLSGKRKTRLAKVCNHKVAFFCSSLILIPYSGTFRSCGIGINSKTLY